MRDGRCLVLLVLVFVMTGCDFGLWVLSPFVKGCRRSPVSECKSNLKALYTAQRSLFMEEERVSEFVAETGFRPERGNRYAYFLSSHGPLEERTGSYVSSAPGARGIGVDVYKHGPGAALGLAHLPAKLAGGVTVGVHGQCPDCEFVAACVGNIDGDPTLDVWSIASFDRAAPDGEPIPAGESYNDVSDVDR